MSPRVSASSPPGNAVVGAIPARFASTRLPGKPLLELAGKPIIEHVYRRASLVEDFEDVVVLTDDERIQAAVEAFGGRCQLTPEDCASGTDRVAWAARSWSAAAVVNIQGDEPMVEVGELAAVARHLKDHPDDPMVTLATPCPPQLVDDPNAVKVVVDGDGYALYFSRCSIPYARGERVAETLLHVGVYGYQRRALLEIAELPRSPLERTEGLEQLRALENGYRIRVLRAAKPAVGVDTPEDLKLVERLMKEEE